MDKPLIEEEYEIKTIDLNGVSAMYSIAKHHVEIQSESEDE